MFVILQKYDFSSKSQHISDDLQEITDVCDTAKVRFFKQITTNCHNTKYNWEMFVILQKYDFSSKSQRLCFRSLWANWCLWYCKSTIFQANHNRTPDIDRAFTDVCDTAKVRFFKQITTRQWTPTSHTMMFVILQKYDFSSKSQRLQYFRPYLGDVCDTAKVRFFKQITTNGAAIVVKYKDVCDTAKVRFFKQITTQLVFNLVVQRCLWYCKSTIFQANHNHTSPLPPPTRMFVILQKYDFSSKSQPRLARCARQRWCLWYCKSTIFQANHNTSVLETRLSEDVCDTAKVRFFKQITTMCIYSAVPAMMFVILQKYDFSSKSQRMVKLPPLLWDVCDTAKVRFFKQITTGFTPYRALHQMFVILQKYDFSSKSQHIKTWMPKSMRCLWYCKSTIFQANHNGYIRIQICSLDVCDTAKVRFFKQITTISHIRTRGAWCLWYCKSTIFQANHNSLLVSLVDTMDVCDTAKVRFFKQITTDTRAERHLTMMFVILQKYDFSSKSQHHCGEPEKAARCLWYCKSTIFQANHNLLFDVPWHHLDVCDTAKVRFFKQITTRYKFYELHGQMFVILQKYDFSSKSQHNWVPAILFNWCLWYCKSTIFQANHNSAIIV